MSSLSHPSQSLPPTESPEGRILRIAREHLFAFGYCALTMDDLAHELGISKKTLYLHFPSKESIAEAIFDEICEGISRRLEAIVSNPGQSFSAKLRQIIDLIGSNMARFSPLLFRDLQRFAPAIYDKIDAIRRRNVPLYFGRLIREAKRDGLIRRDVDPDFATQFWLQSIRGLLQPDVLDQLKLTPPQTLDSAANIFFAGILSPAGLLDYEKVFSSRK